MKGRIAQSTSDSPSPPDSAQGPSALSPSLASQISWSSSALAAAACSSLSCRLWGGQLGEMRRQQHSQTPVKVLPRRSNSLPHPPPPHLLQQHLVEGRHRLAAEPVDHQPRPGALKGVGRQQAAWAGQGLLHEFVEDEGLGQHAPAAVLQPRQRRDEAGLLCGMDEGRLCSGGWTRLCLLLRCVFGSSVKHGPGAQLFPPHRVQVEEPLRLLVQVCFTELVVSVLAALGIESEQGALRKGAEPVCVRRKGRRQRVTRGHALRCGCSTLALHTANPPRTLSDHRTAPCRHNRRRCFL
jgi:hypothetical protein